MKKLIICLCILCVCFCSDLWAKDTDCDEGFVCHVITKEDVGWTYFALSYGIPVKKLRAWNPRLSKKGIDYFPIGEVLRYKTSEMENDLVDEKISRAIDDSDAQLKENINRAIDDIQTSFREENSRLQGKIAGLENRPKVDVRSIVKKTEEKFTNENRKLKGEIAKISETKKRYFILAIAIGFLILIFLFFVAIILRKNVATKRNNEKRKPEYAEPVIVQTLDGVKYSFSPIRSGHMFLKPYMKGGEINMASFVQKKELERSFQSSLRKTPELFDIIRANPEKYGKIEKINSGFRRRVSGE